MRRSLDIVSLLLVVLGAVTWGLVGLFKFDLVATIAGEDFGEVNGFSRIIYILVGLSGIYHLSLLARFFNDDADRVLRSERVVVR